MNEHPRSSQAWNLALAVAAMCAVAACSHSNVTGPNGGGGGGTSFSNALFVSATTGSDANTGTKKAPFATINAAIAAADSGKTIVVAGGTYDESVGLRSGITLMGGYDPSSWKRDTTQFPTEVDDSMTALSGHGVSNVVVDGFRLSTLQSSPFGVVTLDSSTAVEIRGSTISAAKGDNGQPGYDYSADMPGATAAGLKGSSAVLAACIVSGGSAGGAGSIPGGSDGGAGGKGNLTGGSNGSPGSGANPGAGGAGGAEFGAGASGKSPPSAGAAGAAGQGGGAFGAVNLQFGYLPAEGDNGQDGGGGYGGGGGGGGGGDLLLGTCGAWGGGGGQGGAGGYGGGGGFGGFASIGIVVDSTSQLQLDASTVVTAGGGDGGAGGAGAPGGPGGAGGAGGAGTGGAGAGGRGGSGGAGGHGGQGGGGGGGPSIGVLVLGSGQFAGNGVVYQIGAPGAGGASSSQSATGMRGDSAAVDTLQ